MLSDNHLDDLLDSAAPQIAYRSEELTQALFEVAQGAEVANRAGAQSRRPKRTSRYLVAAGALASVVGVGGAAMAGGLIPTWTPWRAASGTLCSMKYTVDPVDSALARETADAPRPVYSDPATVEANSYLAQYDFASVDRDAAVDRFEQELRVQRAAIPADQRQPVGEISKDEIQIVAMSDLVSDQLAAHMKAAGFNPDSIVVRLDVLCDQ